jgi:Ca2+/H+ antiporter, TMEM165/GDT1 family
VEAFITSTLLVAIAEIGDKTQLLSFILAARFPNQPLPIIAGIFVATVANHFMAAGLGQWIASLLSPGVLRWILAGSFFVFAIWALVPDKLDDVDPAAKKTGVFFTTVLLFFMAEMGDKTQLATVALAAQYQNLIAVVLGTTLGMMAANVPAVLIGDALIKKLPLHIIRYIAAGLFALVGVLILFVR